MTAVKVAAAAGEDSLEVYGVRLGDSVRQEGAKGRYGDSGCLGGPLFPSLAGCGEHRGPQQDRGCKRAFRAPPALRSTQHRLGPASTGARGKHLQTKLQPKLPRVTALTPVLLEASERQLPASGS